MRRRAAPGPVPEALCRYVPSEWPGEGADGIREWKTACLAWLAADPARRLPFGDFGGPVDALRESMRLIRAC